MRSAAVRLTPASQLGLRLASYTCTMSRFFSDLDLDGGAPVRARPRLGEWGPELVTPPRRKKLLRVWVALVFAVAVGAIAGLMYVFYRILMGH